MNLNKETGQILVPDDPNWIEPVGILARRNVERYESCTQSIIAAFLSVFGRDEPMVMRAAGGMFGGLVSSLTCGVITGGVMVLGILMGRERLESGIDGLFPIVVPTRELVARLTGRLGASSCRELTGVDFSDLNQAIAFHTSPEHEKCVERVEQGAAEIAKFIDELNRKGELFRAAEPIGPGRVPAVRAGL